MRFPFVLPQIMLATIWALAACVIVLFVARRALAKHERTVPFKVMVGLPIAAVLAVVIAFSVIVVDVGAVAVVVTYGSVQKRRYDAGVHFVIPGSRSDAIVIRRQIIEISSLDPDVVTPAGAAATPDAQRTLALTSDRIALAADITLPYSVNPDLAWKLYAFVGPAYESALLVPAARAAVREAVGNFTWTEAVATKRSELEASILTRFRNIVIGNLVGAGFSKEEAAQAFTLMPPQIRRLAPPHTLLTAVADRVAADVNLERQAVLNQIAAKQAEQRANEGLGIRKLIEQLPPGMNGKDTEKLLYALADKERADALQRAVETNQVKIIVLGGGANPPISIPSP